MKDTPYKYDLSEEAQTRLLRLASGPEPSDVCRTADEMRADFLCDQLAKSLPVEEPMMHALPSALQDMSRTLTSIAGKPLNELLLDPETDISTLRKVKNHAKHAGMTCKTQIEKDVFLAIYIAAIASAFLHLNQKITRHSREALKQFFQAYAAQSWGAKELKNLYGDAARRI